MIENNILITKEQGNEIKICFHSRRTQFAFNRWLGFDYPEYWEEKGGHKERVNFVKLLERTECKHILSFPLLPFQEVLEKNRVRELDLIKKMSAPMTDQEREKAPI